MTDKEKYLQELRDRIEAQRAENRQQQSIFMTTEDPVALKQALEKMSSLGEPELYDKALQIAADSTRDPALRKLALTRLRGGTADHSALQEIALSILQDQDDDATVRKTALDTLQSESFSSPNFSENKAEFKNSLRRILDDENQELRARAAEQLARDKDEFVQRRLLEEIESGESFLVNRAKAIQLLGYDLHAEHYPVLRRILQEESSTLTEKNEAILALANDTNSKGLLEEITIDKDMPRQLRISGANALRSQDPGRFEAMAKKIVVDKDEYNDIRIVCMNNLLHQPGRENIQSDDDFLEKLRRIKGVRRSPELKRLSREYLNKSRGEDSTQRGKKAN